jgi:putative transposase
MCPTTASWCWSEFSDFQSGSMRRVGAALGQHRSTRRKPTWPTAGEAALTAEVVELARRCGGGYRRITALLRRAGWRVNAKRVERIWPSRACLNR